VATSTTRNFPLRSSVNSILPSGDMVSPWTPSSGSRSIIRTSLPVVRSNTAAAKRQPGLSSPCTEPLTARRLPSLDRTKPPIPPPLASTRSDPPHPPAAGLKLARFDFAHDPTSPRIPKLDTAALFRRDYCLAVGQEGRGDAGHPIARRPQPNHRAGRQRVAVAVEPLLVAALLLRDRLRDCVPSRLTEEPARAAEHESYSNCRNDIGEFAGAHGGESFFRKFQRVDGS